MPFKLTHSAKVLIAIPVLLVGGTEMQTLNLVNVLVGAGCNVTVCCYYEYDQSMVNRFEGTGAKVLLMKYERAKDLWHLAKGLIQLFKTMKPDIVHVQYVAPGLVPIIAAKLAGIKIVFATVHQPGTAYGLKAKILLRTATRFCTAFFCVSKAVEESWFGSSDVLVPTHINKNRTHFTLYNAVDADRIEGIVKATDKEELRKSLGINGKKVVGVVGRLRREKGQGILLDAMPAVVKVVPDSVLVVVGDGPDRDALNKQAAGLKILDNIIWLGQKTPEEVYQLYSIMDVVAVPSLFEGFGLSAAEAMLAGAPVVASRVDGLSEVVQHEVMGYLVNSGNSRELAAAIVDLLSDTEKAKRFGKAGYLYVKDNFSAERFRKLTLSSYERYAKWSA